MSSKSAFTEDEWKVLQWAVTDTMTYVALADAGFWDAFKEASAAAKFMAKAKSTTDSTLVHDLAGSIKVGHDKTVTHDKADVAGAATKRVREAAGVVAKKAPDDLDAFKAFIMGVAHATAEAAHGVNDHEADALHRLEGALK